MKNKTEEKKTEKEVKTKTKGSVINFALDRDTKGAVRFKEVDEDGDEVEKDQAAIRTLYVRKSFLKKIGVKGAPESCLVTINFE